MDWDSVAAISASIAAIFVGWQSWETRKTARASRDAVGVAIDALELARKEEGNTRSLLAEAVRSRIDSVMPRITVTADLYPVRTATMTATPLSEVRQDVPEGMVFRLPKDGGNFLCLTYQVEVANDSDQHVVLRVSRFIPGRGQGPDDSPFTLVPRGKRVIQFEIWRSVAAWVDGLERSEYGGTSWWSGCSLSYSLPRDTSATDVWTLEVEGSPLVPVPDEQASYRVGTPELAVLRETKHHRTYFLSRSRNEELA